MRRALSIAVTAVMLIGVLALPGMASTGSITDKVVNDKRFDILQELVIEAGLDGALAGNSLGDLTVFAPTDGAFRRLVFEVTRDWRTAYRSSEAEIAEAVKGVAGADLAEILTYHVYNGELSPVPYDVAKTLRPAASIEMLNGGAVEVRGIADRFVRLTDENNRKMWVVDGDIDASNGVIHAISRVLLP